VSDPQVRLHDVSIDGEADHTAAVLAAAERAVAQVVSTGGVSSDALRSAVSASVTEVHRS
jgi:hypothetical protein